VLWPRRLRDPPSQADGKVADPIFSLALYTGDGDSTFEVVSQVQTAFAKAVAGIEGIPDLPHSPDPSADVLKAYGPLIKVTTETLFYALIDLKKLSQAILGPLIPGYTAYTNGLE
jgi:hypothetical protein